MTNRTRSRVVISVAAALVVVFAVGLLWTFRTDGGPADDVEATAPGVEAGASAPAADAPGDQGPSGQDPAGDATAPARPSTPAADREPGDPAAPEQPASPAPDVSLEWTGPAGSALTVSGSLWGSVTVVPGDADTRTITVRNDGPTDGVLTASIVNATAFRDPADPRWVHDTFYDDLTINGIAGSALEGAETRVHEVELARGATAHIPLSFAFDGWSGNRTGGGLEAPSGAIVNPDGVGPRVFTFDVQLRIAGDTRAELPGENQGTGVVAETGGAVLPRSPWLLLAAAALLLVAAGASRALHRKPVAECAEPRDGARRG